MPSPNGPKSSRKPGGSGLHIVHRLGKLKQNFTSPKAGPDPFLEDANPVSGSINGKDYATTASIADEDSQHNLFPRNAYNPNAAAYAQANGANLHMVRQIPVDLSSFGSSLGEYGPPTSNTVVKVEAQPPPTRDPYAAATMNSSAVPNRTDEDGSNYKTSNNESIPECLPIVPPKGFGTFPAVSTNLNTTTGTNSEIENGVASNKRDPPCDEGADFPVVAENTALNTNLDEQIKELESKLAVGEVKNKERVEALHEGFQVRFDKQKAEAVVAGQRAAQAEEEQRRLQGELIHLQQEVQNTVANAEIAERNRITENYEMRLVIAESKATEAAENVQQLQTRLGDVMLSNERTLNSKEEQITKLNHILHQKEEDLTGFRRDVQQQAQKINRMLNEAGQQCDNNHFIEKHEDLQKKVKTWASHYFKGPLDRPLKLGDPNAYPHRDLRTLTDDCNIYINSDDLRPMIIQAYVWSILDQYVFASRRRHSPALFWAYPHQRELSSLFTCLYPNKPTNEAQDRTYEDRLIQYYKWKAVTTRLFAEKNAGDPPRCSLDSIADLALETLKRYVTFDHRKEKIDREWEKDFGDILIQAVELDCDMNQQRAALYFDPVYAGADPDQPYGFPFNTTVMETDFMADEDEMDPGEPVGLVIWPALKKVGNYEGKDFLKEPQVLVKSRVRARYAPSKSHLHNSRFEDAEPDRSRSLFGPSRRKQLARTESRSGRH